MALSLGGRTATGDAAKPLSAIEAAVRALAGQLAAPPLPADRVAELGAPSEPAARRIEAILRRHAARLTEDPAAELSEAMGLAPRSPWPRLLALPDAVGPQAQRLRDDVLAGATTLPEALAEAARGEVSFRAPKTENERDDATSALRRAYAARPDDGHVAAALAAALLSAGHYEEAAAVGLRSADRAPDQSLAPLAVLVEEARRILRGPSSAAACSTSSRPCSRRRAAGMRVRCTRRSQDAPSRPARASRSASTLGLPSATGRAWARDLVRAAIEIADDAPAAGRALAQPFLGSPSAGERRSRRGSSCSRTCWRGTSPTPRQRSLTTSLGLDALGDSVRAAERWVTLISIRRTLDMPPSDLVDAKQLEAMLPGLEEMQSPLAAVLRGETFLIQLARLEKRPADAADVQQTIETYARKVARGDRARQDDVSAAALPVVAVSSLESFRSMWRSLGRARFSAKLPYLLTYGIASEKAGDNTEAERAYRAVASAPLGAAGLTHLAARFRLASLPRQARPRGRGKKWRESATRVLKSADAGIVEALTRPL